jgi:protein O-GlcNAc transferase
VAGAEQVGHLRRVVLVHLAAVGLDETALHNLGVLKDRQGKLTEAMACYRRALAISPTAVDTLRNLAVVHQRLDQLDEARVLLEELARIDPDHAGLYMLRRALLISSIIPDAGYPARVRDTMNGLLDEYLVTEYKVAAPEAYTAPYFFLSYHGISNRELHAKIAQAYLRLCPALAWEAPGVRTPRLPGRRLRIGIASANLYNHSIGHTTRGLVERLDRALFEVVVVRLGTAPEDDIGRAIDGAADAVSRIATDDLQQARQQIAALSLDILFYQDIGMEPYTYLLSFSRLARVQLTSFGHPDTTGVPNMDYFVSSEWYELDGAQAHYTEKLVLLPRVGTLSYYYAPAQPPQPASRVDFGLSDDDNLYFCPQALFKVHPDMDDAFLAIIQRDPRARIVFIDPGQLPMRANLEKRLRAALGASFDRIQFVTRMPHAQYLGLMRCADVMLDTVHFNGQNTNLEAFAMCIPVVTWPGVMQRERHTVGMYQAMGLSQFEDLVAANADDYAEKAVRVATDAAHRQTLRARIAEKRGILYENIAFVRSIEQAFLRMMQQREARAGSARP